jgi:hypothetical protein
MNINQRKRGILSKGEKWAAAVGALVASIYLILVIFRSTNSTSVIGIIFLPIAILIGALLGSGVLWILRTFLDFKEKRICWNHPRLIIAICILLFALLATAKFQLEKRLLKSLEEKEISNQNLEEIFHSKYLFLGEKIRKYIIENSSLPVSLQKEVMNNSNSYLVGLMGENPSLSQEILESLVNEKPSYERQFGIAQNPNLMERQMVKLLKVKKQDFGSDAEFRLYQTFVMAPIVRRKDLTENAFSNLKDFSLPEVFLQYAILESPFLQCKNFQNFSHQNNPVIEAAIENKFRLLECRRN